MNVINPVLCLRILGALLAVVALSAFVFGTTFFPVSVYHSLLVLTYAAGAGFGLWCFHRT